MSRSRPWRALCAASAGTAALLLSGCASNPVDAQWSDPQLAGNPLRGARVLVVCESQEEVLRRICADQLAAQLQARGATAVQAPLAPSSGAPRAARDDGAAVAAARTAGASAVWASTVGPDDFAATERPSAGVSIGLGGFGIGRSSGGGVGVGISVPVGGGAAPQYAASARVIEAASGRLLWTARTGAASAGDASAQIDQLLQRLTGAASKAGLF